MSARSIRNLWVAFVVLEPLPTCPVEEILGGYTTTFVRSASEEGAKNKIVDFLEWSGFSVVNIEIGTYKGLPGREKRKPVMKRLERHANRIGGVQIGSIFTWDTDDD